MAGVWKWLMWALPAENGHTKEEHEPAHEKPHGAPGPYPFQYIRDVELRGRPYVFRPIRSDDDIMMLDLFSTFSEETIYRRFFTMLTMTPEKVKRFTHINYRTEMAIVAEESDSAGARRLTGVARYAASKDRRGWGEMAFVVGDPWHRRGLGSALMGYLLEVARNEGYEGLSGYVHYDNLAVHRIFEMMDLRLSKVDTGMEIRYDVYLSRKPGPVKVNGD